VIKAALSLHSWDVATRSQPRPASDGGKPPGAATAVGAAFRKAFDDHVRFVWRALLGLGVAEADVADASQQVFVVLHDRLADLLPGASLRTFVYGICLRVASDFRRRAHRRYERLVAEPPERATGVSPERRASDREALDALEAALDRLPAAQREVFVLFELEELPMDEIAAALVCPLQTAYSRLRLARRAVAEMLGEHLIGIEEAK
jgi:RNA polymerase sigma-70 factor, ECF subfamily